MDRACSLRLIGKVAVIVKLNLSYKSLIATPLLFLGEVRRIVG